MSKAELRDVEDKIGQGHTHDEITNRTPNPYSSNSNHG